MSFSLCSTTPNRATSHRDITLRAHFAADMASLAEDRYIEVHEECCKLHDQEKWEDCIALSHHNLSDHSMPRFFKIKTLLLLTGAVDDWWQAEVRH